MKKFARVYVNLKLSENEKFVVYGTMVKTLATLKSPCAKSCCLMPSHVVCYNCLNVLAKKVFLNLTCQRYESSKK